MNKLLKISKVNPDHKGCQGCNFFTPGQRSIPKGTESVEYPEPPICAIKSTTSFLWQFPNFKITPKCHSNNRSAKCKSHLVNHPQDPPEYDCEYQSKLDCDDCKYGTGHLDPEAKINQI